ncbi:MAG: 16S rRNA (cytosine(967)-C(5))-methyltransferase RsmB [Chromatiales bacterium]|nr:16S rRNA (cytosine(967)-C(5))-methyltransferase RsmB [Chromatiales bacterium]
MTDRAARRPAPPGAKLRAAAALGLHRVVAGGKSADDALAEAEGLLADPRDRPALRALLYGALRWHCQHRALLATLLERPLPGRDQVILALLSVGFWQLREPRQPGYAVVSACVEATRLLGRPRAAGLVNALLRRFQREGQHLLSRLTNEEARHACPQWLIEQLRADWPEDWPGMLERALRHPPLWLRVNRARNTRDEWCARAGLHAEPLPDAWPDAVRLAEPCPVSELPGFDEGLVSVQDAAAQLAAPLLDVGSGMRVLDACAAPGGKTAHLLEQAAGTLDLVALDSNPARLSRLQETLARLGQTATVMTGDATRPEQWWDGRPFDRILVDAPCSGTGVIRRHPDIRYLRRPGDIEPMARRQVELLGALWPLLREGGQLLYATCSVLRAEGDAVVAGFLAATPGACERPLPPPAAGALRHLPGIPGAWCLPDDRDTDGFYYALIGRMPEAAARFPSMQPAGDAASRT